MNAYNPLESMKRLEGAGFDRRHAEAIASEMRDYVTKDQLDTALDKQTIKIGIMMSALIALACTVMGIFVSTS